MRGQPPPNTAGDPGLWCQRLSERAGRKPFRRSALFLDRDGVLVEEVNYLHRVEDMRILAGAPEAIRAVNKAGVPVVIVTNQSGIGRGYYDWAAFAALQDALVGAFAQQGAHFDMVLACGYHADGQPPYDTPNHPWRKPKPGMIVAAADTLALDLSRSWIVGDSKSDIAAGRNAGLVGATHVLTGHGARDREAVRNLVTENYDVETADDLASAMPRIMSYIA